MGKDHVSLVPFLEGVVHNALSNCVYPTSLLWMKPAGKLARRNKRGIL